MQSAASVRTASVPVDGFDQRRRIGLAGLLRIDERARYLAEQPVLGRAASLQ